MVTETRTKAAKKTAGASKKNGDARSSTSKGDDKENLEPVSFCLAPATGLLVAEIVNLKSDERRKQTGNPKARYTLSEFYRDAAEAMVNRERKARGLATVNFEALRHAKAS